MAQYDITWIEGSPESIQSSGDNSAIEVIWITGSPFILHEYIETPTPSGGSNNVPKVIYYLQQQGFI